MLEALLFFGFFLPMIGLTKLFKFLKTYTKKRNWLFAFIVVETLGYPFKFFEDFI